MRLPLTTLLSIIIGINAFGIVRPLNYTNGTYQVTSSSTDTIKRPSLFFSVSSGLCAPNGTYSYVLYNRYDDSYAGFASMGYCVSFNTEIRNNKGWALLLQGNYYHNGFNASELIAENAPYYLIPSYKTAIFSGVTGAGSDGRAYSYSNYSILAGPSKYFYFGEFALNIHVGLGSLTLHVPSINGGATFTGYDTVRKSKVTPTFVLNMPAQGYHGALYSFGLGVELHICKSFYAKAGYDFAVAGITINGPVTITDNTGATVGTEKLYTPLTAVFNNFTLGFEYGL